MSDETPRTLRDYRPQHDEGCKSKWCLECAHTTNFHSSILAVLDNPHHFVPQPCSCGLDALVAPSLPPTVEEARETVLARMRFPSVSEYQLTKAAAKDIEAVDRLLAAQRHASAQEIERLERLQAEYHELQAGAVFMNGEAIRQRVRAEQAEAQLAGLTAPPDRSKK